jgi:hypothetical protein
MDVRDVLMVHGGEELGFALEPGNATAIADERVRQDFDGDVPLQTGVASPVDLTHAAGTDGGEDLERPEAGSVCERHRGLILHFFSPATETLLLRKVAQVC